VGLAMQGPERSAGPVRPGFDAELMHCDMPEAGGVGDAESRSRELQERVDQRAVVASAAIGATPVPMPLADGKRSPS
jgi:hypothetical protein